MKNYAMSNLTAHDLRTKGITAIESILNEREAAIISVRGKDHFVVMAIAQYHYLRECEQVATLAETRADVATGRFIKESPAEHIKRMKRSSR